MNDDDQLKKRIEEWLLSQGCPLEMRVAAEGRNGGFGVTQAHYYSDPELKEFGSSPEFCIELFFKLDSSEGSYYNNIMVVGSYYYLFSDQEKTKPPNFGSIGGEGGFF